MWLPYVNRGFQILEQCLATCIDVHRKMVWKLFAQVRVNFLTFAKKITLLFFLYNILAIHHFSKCVTKRTQCSCKHTQNLLLNIFRIIVEIVSKSSQLRLRYNSYWKVLIPPSKIFYFTGKKMSINLVFNLFLPLFIVCLSLFKSKLFRS